MPILHVQLSGDGQQQDGTTVRLPPAMALLLRGPIIQVAVTVAESIAEQILQRGGALPAPISGLGLIDTGATGTCIDDEAAQQLQLPVVDRVNVASATHESSPQNVYPIRLELVGTPISINAPRAIGGPLKAQGLLLLIGRDVLQHCTLHYNGITGEITLAV